MRLWITRSQPGADRQAAQLRASGYDTWVAPVLEIETLQVQPPKGAFDKVVFVSEHAVRSSPGLSFAEPAAVFAVGAQTAAALADAGVRARVPEQESSEGLLALADLQDVRSSRILLVAGEGGRQLLAGELQGRGATVEELVCYRRRAITQLVLDPASIDGIVVSSGDGFRAAAGLWLGAGGGRAVPVLVPSARIAALAPPLGFERVVECAGAGTRAILAGLEQLDGRNAR